MKRLVIIPAYNEARTIGAVIGRIKLKLPSVDILVVDDGSHDRTGDIAKKAHVIVVTHFINRGLGGAIGTGLQFAKQHGYDFAVTFDADGQHVTQDLLTCFTLLSQSTTDVIIGNRFRLQNRIPTDRVILNIIANITTFLFFGIWSGDTQSGFRGFNRRAIELIDLKTDRMEVSSEIFGEIARNKLRVSEMPIGVKYTSYSITKGQKNSNAWPIMGRLVLRLFR